MSYRQLYEVVPLMSAGLLRSARCSSLRRPHSSFAAVARAIANAHDPAFGFVQPWRGHSQAQGVFLPQSAFGNASQLLREMEDDMTSMLQLFDRPSPRPGTAAASQPPSVVFDIKQDDSSFIFEAKVPGLNKEDIKVKLTKDKILVISAQHTATHEDSQNGQSYVHRYSRNFSRRYQLPDNTDTEGIAAKFQDNVLTLTVPKTAVPEVADQEIQIQHIPSASEQEPAASAAAADTAPKPPVSAEVEQSEADAAAAIHISQKQPSA